MGLLSVFDKVTDVADTMGTDASINGNQSKSAVESMAKTIVKPLDELRDMQAHMLYGLDADVVEMVGDLEGGQEALDSIRRHTEAVRNGNLGTVAPSDNAYESEYGVDTFVYSEIAGLEGGEEILGRMAERRDAAREAAADKIGDKIPKIGYVRGEAVNPVLMVSAGGASAVIGDALDAAQAGVSDMFNVVNDFASERTAMAKDALAGVKDVVAETDGKAIDTGVEL